MKILEKEAIPLILGIALFIPSFKTQIYLTAQILIFLNPSFLH